MSLKDTRHNSSRTGIEPNCCQGSSKTELLKKHRIEEGMCDGRGGKTERERDREGRQL